ncbi:hypothetical protein AK830_g9994 [Neonectria ditissima]|uniref:Ketoreductase (KR) domain-containing protein n=1 Tax=Neonectria ditissima TaxID=78410 RepID=A0A0P7AQZ7_9HYPO|nr:hypothetical protein AK830_g9994 [Neonectria ditissima]
MSEIQTILITGANRGIGKGLTTTFLQKPSTTFIAAVRDLSKSSKALADLPKAEKSRLILVKLDVAIESDPAAAVETLRKEHGIESLDVVVANAGISKDGKPVIESTTSSITEHFAINTIGPVVLFQATAPLLKASKSGRPTFVAITSLIGTIGGLELLAPLPPTLSPYGASKAALNWFIRRIHFEEDWLLSFVLRPGLVLTDMTAETFGSVGIDPKEHGAITVEQSVGEISQ